MISYFYFIFTNINQFGANSDGSYILSKSATTYTYFFGGYRM
jgi:hypothetical protein